MPVPKYRSPLSSRLPPAKLALFRSVVSHPPSPFAVQTSNTLSATPSTGTKGKGKAKSQSPTTTPPPVHPLVGAHSIFYSSSPRPLIPLTTSPINHKLWNPPAPDSQQTRSIEKDESGRLAKFTSRFRGTLSSSSEETTSGNEANKGKKGEEELFGVEGDLSWLEGVTLQSPAGGLGKKDIVGAAGKKDKKGKK
ncbi:hypothetical protein JCM16303_002519 [Sporobolomyces ruberrimus]